MVRALSYSELGLGRGRGSRRALPHPATQPGVHALGGAQAHPGGGSSHPEGRLLSQSGGNGELGRVTLAVPQQVGFLPAPPAQFFGDDTLGFGFRTLQAQPPECQSVF